MLRCTGAVLVAFGLVLGGIETAGAQEEQPPPEVPEVVQIEDPAGDANYLGDDQTTPADLTISDLLKVWWTNDATSIAVHFQTEAPPPSGNASYVYRANTNPGDDEDGCLRWEAIVEGPTYVGESVGRLVDQCTEDAEPVEGEVAIVEASDGTGITTVTIPRTAHELLAPGSVITSPWAIVLNNTGSSPRLVGPAVDDTQVGTDYTIADGKKKKKKKKKKRTKGPDLPTVVATGGSYRIL